MGSVSDYIDCPQCGNEAHQEFYYKTGEENILCMHCGYSRRFAITNFSDQGTEDWVPNYELEELKGYGSYRIRGVDQIASEVGGFDSPEGVAEFLAIIEDRRVEIAHAEYTTIDEDGQITNHVVIMGDKERDEE